MPYSVEVIKRAKARLAAKKADRESQYNRQLAIAYEQQPRLRQIDLQLRRTMTLAAQAAFIKGGDAGAAMEQVRAANLCLQQERRQLLEEGFGPGFLEEGPVCAHCGGSGYIGTEMCACLKELCRQEQKQELLLLTTGAERFENFRLDYYPEQVEPAYGVSPRKLMERNLAICRRYAEGFRKGAGNLLFVGGTGLGKTFLSACIANEVADKGYSVAYETASHLFEKLTKNQFDGDDATRAEAARFAGCDLLILDDLGTELTTSVVIAALYGLVNDRLLADKSTLISTNLNIDEIARRYSPQIASRLQGSYKGLTFIGADIRVMKSRGM